MQRYIGACTGSLRGALEPRDQSVPITGFSDLRYVLWPALRGVGALILCMMVAGCALPRSGPTDSEIRDFVTGGDGAVVGLVPITSNVAAVTRQARDQSIPAGFGNADVFNTDVMLPGDNISVSIYENVEDGVLANSLQPADVVELKVGVDGGVFLPYVGRLKAAGKTPEQFRLLVARKLEEQTPNPQIIIRRTSGMGGAVVVLGQVAAAGRYPLDISSRTLSGLVAQAGGLKIDTDVARITLRRGPQLARLWANDLYGGTVTDLALRPGDRVLVEEDPRQFTALGAFGGQTLVPFDRDDISLVEALGLVGGLNAATANPTGVFVFRREAAETLARLALDPAPAPGADQVIYGLDLRDPAAVFAAGVFLVRDDDVLYVTEAAYARTAKLLAALTSPLNTVASVQTLAQ